MISPRVSVLIPAFNAEDTLETALGSLMQQSLGDFDCVIVDDGSTDATLRVAQSFSQRDPRFLTLQRPHGGIVAALNFGIGCCRGKYVARLDADDVAAENRLLAQLTYLEERSELCAVGCHVELFPRDGLREGRLSYESWLNSLTCEQEVYRDRFVECPLAHPSLFLRREALLQLGYRDMPWAEDYDLVLRLLGANLRLGVVPEKLVYWRDRSTRLSRTDRRYSNAQFVDCKAHFLAQDWLGNCDGYILWGYGNTGRELCRALLRNGKRPSFIVEKHPGRIGQYIAGARVITPEALAKMPGNRERIVVSVAGAGPRDDVRQIAKSLSLVEGVDFVCAA